MASGENETKSPSCSLCSEDGQTSIAGYYCVECETYLCPVCVKSHKLPALKTHQINRLDCPDSIPVSGGDITVRGSDAVSGQSVKCSLHGKLIDTYCQDHDEVVCGTCAAVKHRSCTTVSIAIASKDYKTSQEIKTYRDKLTENLDKCKQENEKRKHNRESIDKEKLELIENVDKHEEKMIARIKELAEISRQEIRSQHEKDTTDLDNHIDTLDVVIATNADYLNKLDNTDDDELFVLAKMNCKTVIKDGETLIETITKDWTEKHILFHFDQTLEDCVNEMKSLGRLDDNDMNGRDVNKYVATFHSNVNVKQGNEGDTHILDMCLLDCNTVLVIDHNNNKLKRLNTDLQFKNEIKLSGMPIAVCKTGNNEVAVRIWDTKVVQFVSVGQSLQLATSFKLNGNGYGMTYDAEKQEIFACEKNKVSVYSKAGTKLRTYDGETMLSGCRQIALSDNKQDIYVTDYNNKGLIVLDAKKGTLKFKVTVPDVNDPWPLCLLPGGICLVGGWSSDVIVQIDREGKTIGNLIQSKDGRTYTCCAVYDRECKRLLVGGYPNVISVYSLTAK